MTINERRARQLVSKIVNIVPRAAIWSLVILGILLIVHQFWLFIEISLYSHGGRSLSHWLIRFGWAYLFVGGIGIGLLYWETWANFPLSLRRIFLISVICLLINLVIFHLGVLQPESNESFETILGFAFLIYPLILAFPIGIAVRTRNWSGISEGVLLWFVSWLFFYIIAFGWVNLFILIFTMGYIFIVMLFTLPTFIAGLFINPEMIDDSSKEVL